VFLTKIQFSCSYNRYCWKPACFWGGFSREIAERCDSEVLRRKEEEKKLQTAQVSDLCRRRLLNYADSFHELAKSYDQDFGPEYQDRGTVLMERRLWENRQIIRDHLNEMAKIMTEAACEVLVYQPMEGKKRRLLVQAMAEEGIRVESPCYLPRANGQQAIVLTMSTQRGAKVSAEEAADMISVILEKRLQLSVASPCVVEGTPQSFVLEEEAGFLVLTGFSRAVKEDEIVSGDNYSVIEAEKGRVTVMLSDGTGSGEEAGRDSEKVLDLMEKMLEAGFSVDAAIKMVNTALFALGEDRNHPTLDICDIDLYQGNCQLRKVGGSVTFLKKPEEVELLVSGNLPLGIFQQVEVQPMCKTLQDGDFLIMVSDGVVDAFEEDNYEEAMTDIILGFHGTNPGEMAEHLLRSAIRASRGKIADDMTIGVIGIWET